MPWPYKKPGDQYNDLTTINQPGNSGTVTALQDPEDPSASGAGPASTVQDHSTLGALTSPAPKRSPFHIGSLPTTTTPTKKLWPYNTLDKPVDPTTTTTPASGKPYQDLWDQSAQDPQRFVQALIAKENLVGHQIDPAAINKIVEALKGFGVNASLDQRNDQYHKGIMLNGQFVKLLNGSDQWIWDPASAAADGGGAQTMSLGALAGGGLLAPYAGQAPPGWTRPEGTAGIAPAFQAPAGAPGAFVAPGGAPDAFAAPEGAPGQFAVPEGAPGAFVAPEGAPGTFHAPTLEEARNEPGYQFAADEGRKRMENSAAFRGTLNSGATLKDILAWGNRFGEQNYGNVFNRALTQQELADREYASTFDRAHSVYDSGVDRYKDTYSRAQDVYQSGVDRYADTYGRAKDVYSSGVDRYKDAYTTAADVYKSGVDRYSTSLDTAKSVYDTNLKNRDSELDRAWKEYLAGHDIFEADQQNQYDRLHGIATLGMNANN